MVRTANPLEADHAFISSAAASAFFLNDARWVAEGDPVVPVLVTSLVWLSAPLAKTQSPPIQSPQSINQWFPIPIVATEVLASLVNVSVSYVTPQFESEKDVVVDIPEKFLMWYPNEALKELPKKYLAFKP